MKRIFVPSGELALHTFYYLVSNAGVLITYEDFCDISDGFRSLNTLRVTIYSLKRILESNGFLLENKPGEGYKCVKIPGFGLIEDL